MPLFSNFPDRTLYADSHGMAVGSISLPSSSWVASGQNFVQTVVVSGYAVTTNTKADLQEAPDVISQLVTDGVSALTIVNNNGTLTVTAVGAKPSTNLDIQISLVEVTSL